MKNFKFSHPFHMVTISPWPLFTSLNMFNIAIGLIQMFLYKKMDLLLMSIFMLIIFLSQWWRDVIRESTFQGMHTKIILKMLRFSMLLFILSEVMFFMSFFWGYFHMALSPSHEIGAMWPPKGIIIFNPYNIPLMNTIILISSGITVTWSHLSLLEKNFSESLISLILTIFLSINFTMFQYYEYYESYFCINDGIFGSIFYMLTGFHGFHVIIGTLFLFVSLIRIYKNHFSSYHHFGFEAAIWYWHFVDVVWLFLYMFVYWWIY